MGWAGTSRISCSASRVTPRARLHVTRGAGGRSVYTGGRAGKQMSLKPTKTFCVINTYFQSLFTNILPTPPPRGSYAVSLAPTEAGLTRLLWKR